MRQTIQTTILILLTGAILAGCGDYRPWTSPQKFAGGGNTDTGNTPYIPPIVKPGTGEPTVEVGNTAVDIGAQAVKRRTETMDKLEEVRKQHELLLKSHDKSQKEAGELSLKLARAEKELTEANEMLVEMQVELAKWKKDVLSFREEMRDSQKVLIEAVTRLHVLISGGVAMDPPKTKPVAPIATNIEEKNGENLR